MKKLFTLLAAMFLSSMLMVGSAQALIIDFDHTGTSSYVDTDRWVLGGYQEENTDVNYYADLFTYQDKTTGYFEQDFTFSLKTGTVDDPITGQTTETDFGERLFADIYLEGYFEGPTIDDPNNQNVSYTGGNVQLYDTVNGVDIGSLEFTNALDAEIDDGYIGNSSASLLIDLEFTFNNDLNPSYFGTDAVNLAGKEWLLSLVGGRLNQEGLFDGDEKNSPGDWIIAWNTSAQGVDAEFAAVPEPTTLLLFGTGLLGLAAFGRKKFMKKS